MVDMEKVTRLDDWKTRSKIRNGLQNGGTHGVRFSMARRALIAVEILAVSGSLAARSFAGFLSHVASLSRGIQDDLDRHEQGATKPTEPEDEDDLA